MPIAQHDRNGYFATIIPFLNAADTEITFIQNLDISFLIDKDLRQKNTLSNLNIIAISLKCLLVVFKVSPTVCLRNMENNNRRSKFNSNISKFMSKENSKHHTARQNKKRNTWGSV